MYFFRNFSNKKSKFIFYLLFQIKNKFIGSPKPDFKNSASELIQENFNIHSEDTENIKQFLFKLSYTIYFENVIWFVEFK